MADIEQVILASGSPTRKWLLETSGIKVIVRKTDAEEIDNLPSVKDIAIENARLKMNEAEKTSSDLPVVTADTIIDFNGKAVGKAATRAEAKQQLSMFAGKTQTVWTGMVISYRGKRYESIDSGDVTFRPLSEKEIDTYLDTGEWIGAAGSYRIQKKGAEIIDRIIGDSDAVAGLSLKSFFSIIKTLP